MLMRHTQNGSVLLMTAVVLAVWALGVIAYFDPLGPPPVRPRSATYSCVEGSNNISKIYMFKLRWEGRVVTPIRCEIWQQVNRTDRYNLEKTSTSCQTAFLYATTNCMLLNE